MERLDIRGGVSMLGCLARIDLGDPLWLPLGESPERGDPPRLWGDPPRFDRGELAEATRRRPPRLYESSFARVGVSELVESGLSGSATWSISVSRLPEEESELVVWLSGGRGLERLHNKSDCKLKLKES